MDIARRKGCLLTEHVSGEHFRNSGGEDEKEFAGCRARTSEAKAAQHSWKKSFHRQKMKEPVRWEVEEVEDMEEDMGYPAPAQPRLPVRFSDTVTVRTQVEGEIPQDRIELSDISDRQNKPKPRYVDEESARANSEVTARERAQSKRESRAAEKEAAETVQQRIQQKRQQKQQQTQQQLTKVWHNLVAVNGKAALTAETVWTCKESGRKQGESPAPLTTSWESTVQNFGLHDLNRIVENQHSHRRPHFMQKDVKNTVQYMIRYMRWYDIHDHQHHDQLESMATIPTGKPILNTNSLAALGTTPEGRVEIAIAADPACVMISNVITATTKHLTPDMLSLVDLSQDDIDIAVRRVLGGVANIQDIYALSSLQDGNLFHHKM
ncbi:hypothetical protein BG004_006973, partial [Podila humilis]